jgi:hypothetical protein
LPRVPDWIRKVQEEATERWDRAIEAGSRVGVRPIWNQMQRSAADGAESECALVRTVEHLAQLKGLHPKLQVHLIAHSAGSIVLGHLFPLLKAAGLSAATCTLWAPACTVPFARQYYRTAIEDGTLPRARLFFNILSDERERADTVGPYNKSLLYLVSQSLERERRMPLLGMQCAWRVAAQPHQSPWSEAGDKAVEDWLKFWGPVDAKQVEVHDIPTVSNGLEQVPLVHGSFDNDVDVVSRTLLRVLATTTLDYPVTNLKGF